MVGIAKLLKGIASPEEMAELLSAVGVQMEMRAVTLAEAGEALKIVREPGVKLFTLEMKMKDGKTMLGLMVMPPPETGCVVKGAVRALPEPA